MSSRSQHVITRPEEVISHTRLEVISQHAFTIAACHHSSRSSRHFACMLILAARPFRAQHNVLFSLISLFFAAHPLRSPISFYAQNGCSKKIGKRRGPAEQVARQPRSQISIRRVVIATRSQYDEVISQAGCLKVHNECE